MEKKLILTSDFWGTKLIPAVLIKEDGILSGRSDIWIPGGYECGGGGYSVRTKSDIKEFTWADEIRKDVIKKWETEKQENSM